MVEVNVTVGYGRAVNDGGRPLSDAAWNRYQEYVRHAAEQAGGTVHFQGTGTGFWQGEEEPAGCLAFFADPETFAWAQFDASLSIAAYIWRQDAIAVTAAESRLVAAATVPE